MKAVLKSA